MTIYKRRRKLQTLIIGFLKDKASIAKAAALASPTRMAVLRATTHDLSTPPSDRHVSSVLARAGRGPRRESGACVNALMDRLGSTGSAAVALKCLVVAHHVLSRGSFILRDQLSFYPTSGGHNSLNLSAFSDHSDDDTWQLSAWVRWYARVVEQNLAVARVLGYYLHRNGSDDVTGKSSVSSLPSSELLGELDALEDFVERVGQAPESFLGLLENDLAYEVSRLVFEDYKVVQREILKRVNELGDRTSSLSRGELTRLVSGLKRLEDCKERLVSMYLKKRRDDEFWGIIGILKINVVELMVEKKLLSYDHEIVMTEFSNNPFVEPEKLFLLPNSNGLTYIY